MFNPTLEEALQFYFRIKKLKPTTMRENRQILNTVFWDWSERPLSEISIKEVNRRVNRTVIDKPALADKARRFISRLQKAVFQENNRAVAGNVPPTLSEALKEFTRLRKLKPKTASSYRKTVRTELKDWNHLYLSDISQDMIVEKYRELSMEAPYAASYTMRVLRALFNFSMNYFQDSRGNSLVANNPVNSLSALKLWNKAERRKDLVYRQQMQKWLQGTLELKNESSRDMMLFLWQTGCRIDEARSLLWSDVNFECEMVTFRDTKNGKDHTIPVCSFVLELLKSRKRVSEDRAKYVFPGRRGKKMCNNYKGYREMCRRKEINHRHHTLRYTFTSACKSLGIPDTTIRYLLNHSQKNDVTAGYMIWDPDDYRDTVERVSKRLLKWAKYDFESRNIQTPAAAMNCSNEAAFGVSIYCAPAVSIVLSECP